MNLERISSISGSILSEDRMKELEKVNKENKKNTSIIIKETRQKLTSLVNNIIVRPEQLEYQQYMGVERKLPQSVYHQARGFFIPDFNYNNEIFGPYLEEKPLGLKGDSGYPVFGGRFIYPIIGFNNEVIGLTGYDKHHPQTKYLLSKTIGFGQSTTFYGMNMMRWIYSMGYVVPVEGIVDCLWLWSVGIPAVATQGNMMPAFLTTILKRFGYNVLLVPDNDETGERAIKFWTQQLPLASILKVTVGKDLDEWRKKTDNIHLLHEVIAQWRQDVEMRIKREYKLTDNNWERIA